MIHHPVGLVGVVTGHSAPAMMTLPVETPRLAAGFPGICSSFGTPVRQHIPARNHT